MILAILSLILTNIYATELTQICPNRECRITAPQSTITNHSNFIASGTGEGIVISTTIDAFINYGEISVGDGSQQSLTLKNNSGYVGHFINYGIVDTRKMSFWTENDLLGIGAITNYGSMGEISYNTKTIPLVLNNFGIIGEKTGASISTKNGAVVLIQNYALQITENVDTFNKSSERLSHLVINVSNDSGGVRFKDGDSKIILDFGGNFEFGAEYAISKLVVDNSGYNNFKVEFDRLTTKSDIYLFSQRGDNFIVNLAPQYGIIGNLYKANIRTMNNFLTISNAMIYPIKHHKSQNLAHSLLQHSPSIAEGDRGWVEYPSLQDSAFSLKIYESFAYQNESQNLQTRRIKRPNKRNYSRNLNKSQNLAQSDKYYFILTPFINYNLFFESGRYNLRGFDYGFLTAFSAQVAESNSLGAHFAMSYGTLGDSSDKDFRISNLNLNLGVNYNLDLVWDMYLKARVDFFYFLNQVKTLTMREAIKPNNLGFGASVSYGKDFDFKQGGILGIEGGIDYKALNANKITLNSMSETYQKSLYHLLYVDLGISYAKYFGRFGINAGLGIKGNITANKLAQSKIYINTFSKSVDMVLDNDRILGYANIGVSYVLSAKNFDMEFSLAYYGNYGDRVISNGGGFEWRVTW